MGQETRQVARALSRHKAVGIDTCVFIYHFQEDKTYSPATTALFDLVEAGKFLAYTSVLTKLEVFIEPRRRHDKNLIQTLNFALETWPNLYLVAFDDRVIDQAATLRARHNITTPDSIQIASALVSGAGAFVTNDRAVRKVPDIDILLLTNLL